MITRERRKNKVKSLKALAGPDVFSLKKDFHPMVFAFLCVLCGEIVFSIYYA
jgi:hypothetical protein